MPTSQERGDQAQPLISGHRPNTCKDLTLGSTPEGDTKQKATQRGDIDYFSPLSTTDYAVIVMAIDIPSSDAHFNFRPIIGWIHQRKLVLIVRTQQVPQFGIPSSDSNWKNSHGWNKFIGHRSQPRASMSRQEFKGTEETTLFGGNCLKRGILWMTMANRGLLYQEVYSGQHFQNWAFYVNQGIATRPSSSRRRLKVWDLFMAQCSYLWHPVNSRKSRQVPMDFGSRGRAAGDRPDGLWPCFTKIWGYEPKTLVSEFICIITHATTICITHATTICHGRTSGTGRPNRPVDQV